MNRIQADVMLLTIAAIWGLAFVFQKTAMTHIGPFLFLACRALVAAAVLFGLACREHRKSETLLTSGFWRTSVLGGLTLFVAGILQQVGLVTASVTNTGFLTGLYVVVTPLLLWLAYRHLPPVFVWVAVGLAFVGTWLLGGGTLSGFSVGDWLVAISSVFWSANILVIAHAARYDHPIGFTAIQFVVVAVISLCCAFAFETVSAAALYAALPEIAYVGILSSALTFTLLAVAMRYTPTTEATILVSMETLFAALSAAYLLGERLSWIGWTGAALMFSATLLVQLGAVRTSDGKTTP